jgi:DNA-binding NarL/FixJ family response regulator
MLRLRPAVVFIDLALPALGGIAGVPAIQRLHPPVRIVLLARAPTERQALLALAAGARGYCSTDIDPGLIRRADEVVERGEIWIGRQVIPLLLRRLTALADVEERDPSGPLPYLGARERQIALLVGAGANNRDIAAKLAITEATVKAHLTSVFRKLKVPNRLRLALVVTQHAGRDHQAPRHRRAPGLRPVAAPGAEG